MRKEKGAVFLCGKWDRLASKHCQKRFTRKAALTKHRLECHPSGGDQYRVRMCPGCPQDETCYTTHISSSAITHWRKRHKDKSSTPFEKWEMFFVSDVRDKKEGLLRHLGKAAPDKHEVVSESEELDLHDAQQQLILCHEQEIVDPQPKRFFSNLFGNRVLKYLRKDDLYDEIIKRDNNHLRGHMHWTVLQQVLFCREKLEGERLADVFRTLPRLVQDIMDQKTVRSCFGLTYWKIDLCFSWMAMVMAFDTSVKVNWGFPDSLVGFVPERGTTVLKNFLDGVMGNSGADGFDAFQEFWFKPGPHLADTPARTIIPCAYQGKYDLLGGATSLIATDTGEDFEQRCFVFSSQATTDAEATLIHVLVLPDSEASSMMKYIDLERDDRPRKDVGKNDQASKDEGENVNGADMESDNEDDVSGSGSESGSGVLSEDGDGLTWYERLALPQ